MESGTEIMARTKMTKQKFVNQWLRKFAPTLTREQYEKYVQDQCMWHVFSWNLIELDGLVTGDKAREAYNKAIKNECIFCDMYGMLGVSDKLSPLYDTAEKIDENFSEFYVVAKNYSWTYIQTHEGDAFGPYFLKKM